MIKLTDASKNFVFKIRIQIDKDAWVELREPTLIEFKKFGEDAQSNIEAARKLFPLCIVDSNFEDEDGNKATGQQIWSVIEPSASTASHVINEWLSSIPFRTDKDGKADA